MFKLLTVDRVWKLCVGLVFATNLITTPAMGQTNQVNEAKSLPASTQEMAAKNVTINGKVKSVTESVLTVVDSANAEHTVSLDAKTKIIKGGKAATAAEIKADDAVTVVASKGEGDALTAVTITVT